jgi:hypothetical protein
MFSRLSTREVALSRARMCKSVCHKQSQHFASRDWRRSWTAHGFSGPRTCSLLRKPGITLEFVEQPAPHTLIALPFADPLVYQGSAHPRARRRSPSSTLVPGRSTGVRQPAHYAAFNPAVLDPSGVPESPATLRFVGRLVIRLSH